MLSWVDEEFETADFGDGRLNDRMKKILAALAEAPQHSVATAMKG